MYIHSFSVHSIVVRRYDCAKSVHSCPTQPVYEASHREVKLMSHHAVSCIITVTHYHNTGYMYMYIMEYGIKRAHLVYCLSNFPHFAIEAHMYM